MSYRAAKEHILDALVGIGGKRERTSKNCKEYEFFNIYSKVSFSLVVVLSGSTFLVF